MIFLKIVTVASFSKLVSSRQRKYKTYMRIYHFSWKCNPSQLQIKNTLINRNVSNEKQCIIIHYKNLQQVIKYGLIGTEIHRILNFKQLCLLKKYIDINSEMRKCTKTQLKKYFYQLNNNAVFRKEMENVDYRRDIKVLIYWENIVRSVLAGSIIARPNFKAC